VCTIGGDTSIDTRTAWFGHPPFALPRREVVECDASLTHNPSLVRYLNRVFWEALRFTLPVPSLLALLWWTKGIEAARTTVSWPVFIGLVVPAMTLAVPAGLCVMVVACKWLLLGRVKPGQHPLWCCWCSRWDFLFELWGFHAREALQLLEGTLLLSWYLRAMGVRIGRRVVLGHSFSQVVDPDMLEFEDEATVDGQFQAHTFEDRVLKIDTVRVRRGATVGSAAVLLYGADVGEGARVEPHSVVMKKERLLPGRTYEGCPIRMVR
jgi:non-ribosomal peptide synthetase-like protein